MHSPDVIKVQNTPEEHSATLDGQLETEAQSLPAKTTSPLCPPSEEPCGASEEIGIILHSDVEVVGLQEEALAPPDTSGLEQSNSVTTPEMEFQFISESNTVQIPAHLQVAPVLDGTGIEGEDPEDLAQYLWEDCQKLSVTHSALKVYLHKLHGSLDLVMTTRLNAMLHTLHFYLDEGDSMGWRNASQMAAKAAGCGESLAHKA